MQDKLGLSRAVIVSPGGYGRNYPLLADMLAKFPERFRGIALMRDDTPRPSSPGSPGSACAACA